MKITIITDGNNKLGMGHIYQSMTLANLLLEEKSKNIKISFLTKSNKNIIDLIKSNKFAVTHVANDNKIFKILKKEKPDRIIFDKLDVAPELAKRIKNELKIKLIIFTNLTDANKYADVTITADIGSNFKNIYSKNNETGRVDFLGPKYWLLKPDFYKYKKKKKTQKEKVKKIMLIFGGADPSNLSTLVLNELLKIDEKLNIILVLGSAFNHDKELNNVIKKSISSKSKVKIVKNINNVAEVMYNSDVVFASPGLSFFEALSIGTPVVGFHQDELQKETYRELLPTVDKSEIIKVSNIIKNRTFIIPTSALISSMEIGEGKKQIICEILK